jgi:ketosteroid isomerase-like protein
VDEVRHARVRGGGLVREEALSGMAAAEGRDAVVEGPRPRSDATALRAFVYSYYHAVNEGRWEDVVDFFHDDAVLLVPSQLPKIGRETILRFYESHGRRFPEHHDDVPLLMIDGNRVMTLVDFHGVDRNGNDVHFWTSGTFTIESGKIRQYRVIFDTAQLEGPVPPGTA